MIFTRQQRAGLWDVERELAPQIADLLERDEATERMLIEVWKEASAAARHYEVLRANSSQIFLGISAAAVAFFLNQKMPLPAEISVLVLSAPGGALALYFHEAHVWQWHFAGALQTVLLQGKVIKEPKDRSTTYLRIRDVWWEQYRDQGTLASMKLDTKFSVEHSYIIIHVILFVISLVLIVVRAI
jgi:hypothetical protein